MGQFLSASDGTNNEDSSRPPRPSTSSSITRSSETAYTRTSLDSTSTSQQRPIIAPARSSSPQSMLFAPTPSLWSLPTDASHINDPPESDKTIARERATSGPLRIPLTFRGSSGSSGASILPTHRRKRKRKLVISGIPPGDSRRYDHIRLWCEVRLRHALYSTPADPAAQSFGDLNQITRVPNGDLHVDFRSSEVADTVCCMNAQPRRPVLINAFRFAAFMPAFTLTVSAASGCPGLLVNGLDDLDYGVYVLLWASVCSNSELSSLDSLVDFAKYDPPQRGLCRTLLNYPLCLMMLYDLTTPMQPSVKTIISAGIIDP